jgi:hypothetical protein
MQSYLKEAKPGFFLIIKSLNNRIPKGVSGLLLNLFLRNVLEKNSILKRKMAFFET